MKIGDFLRQFTAKEHHNLARQEFMHMMRGYIERDRRMFQARISKLLHTSELISPAISDILFKEIVGAIYQNKALRSNAKNLPGLRKYFKQKENKFSSTV